MKDMELIVENGGRQAVAAIVRRRFGAGARIVHDADGAPILIGAEGRISVSHSRNFAAVAWHGNRRIGVDIEEPRPEQLNRIAARFLSADELTQWSEDLLTAWTIKEAVFKAAGERDLPMGSVRILSPHRAATPSGRMFRIESLRRKEYVVTTAIELLGIELEIDSLTALIASEPMNAEAIYNRGVLHLKLGNHGAALTDFNTAAEINPAGPAAKAAEGLRGILDFHLPMNP